MKKSVIKLIIGSLFSAALMILVAWYFAGHEYSEMMYNIIFIIGVTQFLHFSSEVNKARKAINLDM